METQQRKEFTQFVKQLSVTSWHFPLFYYPDIQHPNFYIPQGQLFTTIRLASDIYVSQLQVGDPVKLEDLISKKVIGKGKVASIKTVQLNRLSNYDYCLLQSGRFYAVESTFLRDFLERLYLLPCKKDELVSVISFRAESSLGQRPVWRPGPHARLSLALKKAVFYTIRAADHLGLVLPIYYAPHLQNKE